MSRARESAIKAYPEARTAIDAGTFIYHFDDNSERREGFIKGYEQAEKDIISIIESRIAEILGDAQPNPVLRIELKELIDRIKKV